MSAMEQFWPMMPVVFGAFFLKAMTGFGAAIIMVSLGAMFLPVQEVVPLCICLDLLAGLALMRKDWSPGTYKYWGPLSVAMGMGAGAGALVLSRVDPSSMKLAIGAIVLGLGVWLWATRARAAGERAVPQTPQPAAFLTTTVAGFCGGLFGISGPPIVWFFGSRFAKADFRRVVVPLFIVASATSLVVYALTGLLDAQTLLRVLWCLPCWGAGLFLGGRAFARVPEERFGQLMAVILCAVGLKMLVF